MSFNSQDYRRALSYFGTGITVVTTTSENNFYGITVNAFCSVSLNPPQVAICIDKAAFLHNLLQKSKVYGVNILSGAQQNLSELFARREMDYEYAFTGIKLHTEETGAPLFDEALVSLDCRIVAEYPGGDHTIFMGQVVNLGYLSETESTGAETEALLYYRSKYRTLSSLSE